MRRCHYNVVNCLMCKLARSADLQGFYQQGRKASRDHRNISHTGGG